jgi:hypothetical protein
MMNMSKQSAPNAAGRDAGAGKTDMKCSQRFYRVDRREIHWVKFIFEDYDGIAVITTENPQAGLIRVQVAPGCETDVDAVMADLAKTVRIERIPGVRPPGASP